MGENKPVTTPEDTVNSPFFEIGKMLFDKNSQLSQLKKSLKLIVEELEYDITNGVVALATARKALQDVEN